MRVVCGRRYLPLVFCSIVQSAQVEATNEDTPRQVDDWAQGGETGGLGLGVNKKKNPSVLQSLEGEGFLAPFDVARESAVGKATAIGLGESIDYAAAEGPRTEAECDLGASLHNLVGGAHAEEAAALHTPAEELLRGGLEVRSDDPRHV